MAADFDELVLATLMTFDCEGAIVAIEADEPDGTEAEAEAEEAAEEVALPSSCRRH
jgi:hypothetical protein